MGRQWRRGAEGGQKRASEGRNKFEEGAERVRKEAGAAWLVRLTDVDEESGGWRRLDGGRRTLEQLGGGWRS